MNIKIKDRDMKRLICLIMKKGKGFFRSVIILFILKVERKEQLIEG